MSIPNNITKEDIIEAIQKIDDGQEKVPIHREGIKYEISYNGKGYPQKFLISLANKIRNGKELSSEEFIANEATRYLENLGFKVSVKENYHNDKEVESMSEQKMPEELTQEQINQKFRDYKSNGQIEFITFHPSYSYEEFIEGITFDFKSGLEGKYILKEGVFKSLCSKALFLALKGINKIETEPTDYSIEGTWRNLYDIYKNLSQEEKQELWKNANNSDCRVVLIIDEINRGDVAKIFGELITSIEDDKRLSVEDLWTCTLPISRDQFGVTPNLFIIGTMNTADRSIVNLDIALRRRFSLEPLWPILKSEDVENKKDYEFINLLNSTDPKIQKGLLIIESLNKKIKDEPGLGQDRLIGHSFLFDLQKFETIEKWLTNKILPLLYEYSDADRLKFFELLKVIKPNLDLNKIEEWYKFKNLSSELAA